MPKKSLLFFFLCLYLIASPLPAMEATSQTTAPDSYLAELLVRAEALALADESHWHRLLHYQPNLTGAGVHSLADSSNFFLSPQGKSDPVAELAATLSAFFAVDIPPGMEQHPQCAFVARYRWLDSQLDFDPERLPVQKCERFETWFNAINASQVTLIFPAAYLNNPSSMFGHTLIRLDPPNQDERTRLLSYAINFAAQTDETNGVIFALKGLFGGYPGMFSVMPYYEKVKEYNDLESRDIWEYQLDFTQQEIRRLLEHAWELGPVTFDYFFFDENCSYQLLALIEVARPGASLTDRFPLAAIPSDTVKVLLEEEGILRQAVFRPSSKSRIDHLLALQSSEQQAISYQLSRPGSAAAIEQAKRYTEQERTLMLETEYDYLQYRFLRGNVDRDSAAGHSIKLLSARSHLPPGEPVEVETPPYRPDQGHGSARVAFSVGYRDEQTISQLQLRPAYHGLSDPQAGFVSGAQVNFFDLTLTMDHQRESVSVERFTLFDIVSLSPRNRFFSPLSWRGSAGLQRLVLDAEVSAPLAARIDGGAGVDYRIGKRGDLFLMLDAMANFHSDLPSGRLLGAGPRLGYYGGAETMRFWLDSRYQWLESEEELYYQEHRIGVAHHFSTNGSLQLELVRRGEDSTLFNEALASIHWYF